jgi:amino acid transporter
MGVLICIYGALGIGWHFAPMHQREILAAGGGTISDTMHILFSFVTVFLMLIAMSFGAAALGRVFRLYSIISIIVLMIFGVLTGIEAPNIDVNQPTPMIGVWERINIGVFLLWVVILATVLIRRGD